MDHHFEILLRSSLCGGGGILTGRLYVYKLVLRLKKSRGITLVDPQILY